MQVAAPELVVITPPSDQAYTDCAVRIITRWEVTSEAAYRAKWSGIYYPAGPITASGPTGGIGYDFGHQTRVDIYRDWREHSDVDRLATASGVTGATAKARIGEWKGIRIEFPYAQRVFGASSLPIYTAGARRLYGKRWDQLEAGARCALVSNGYNRGFGTNGPRRVEIKRTAQVCMPMDGAERLRCISEQLAAQQRLWPNTPGLRARRRDEAKTVFTAATEYRRAGAGPTDNFASLDLPRAPFRRRS